MPKNEMKIIKFPNYKIFVIENGFLTEITEEQIKENDYLIKNPLLGIIVIDKDKRKVRPFVEDLLDTMNIETTNTKRLRLNTIIHFIVIIINIIIIYYIMSLNTDFKKLSLQFNNIEKVKTFETKQPDQTLIFK